MGQSSLCFLRGRSSKFSSVFRYLSNHVEVNLFYLISVWFSFVFIWFIRLLDFLIYMVITVNTVFSVMKILFFLFFVLRYFVSGVCLSIYVFAFCHLKLGVLGPWEFLWRAGSYIFCVCLRCVECRAGTILFGHFLGADGGTIQIFLFPWLCCSGYGTVEMVRGVIRLFLLSSVCCQFSWRLEVCGRIFVLYKPIFFGRFVVLFFSRFRIL